LRDLEKSAGADHLTAATTNRTIDAARTRLGSVTVAFVTDIQFSNFDFLFRAKGRFFQSDLHVVTQIRATLSIFALAGHAAEKCFEDAAGNPSSSAAKNFAKNIERIVKSAAKSPALLERGVTKTIVSGAFIRIHQHIIGFAELFEFLFGVRIARIFVRMKFYGELAIGTLHVLRRGIARNAEHFVVIAFGRRHLD